MAFQCGHLEAQDVFVDCDDVDLLCLEAQPSFTKKQQWLRRLLYHDVSRRLSFVNPGIKPAKLTRKYDLLVLMCQTYWDFLYINAIENWREQVGTSICWIDELWAANLPLYKFWLPSLNRFDHVVVGMRGTVEPLSDALGRLCHYVPAGVDALRFTPLPGGPPRVVDVYSVGRRWEPIHQELLTLAADRQIFYVYDTLQTGESQALDHRQHRDLYANIAKRSRFFMVAPGKVNVPEETRGQVEVGFRYYEGCAAGAVLLGQAPDCDPFREMFDWPDAVVHVEPDGSDVTAVLANLRARPEDLRAIGCRNAREALLRHDWAYRWQRLLEIAGLPPRPELDQRIAALRTLAGAAVD